MTDHETAMLALVNPSLLRQNSEYRAKLTKHERYQILALDKMGFLRPAIAQVFGIARGTVGYICNPSSRHYKDIRKHYNELGREQFIKDYVDEELMARIQKAQQTDPKQTDAEYRESRAETKANGPVNKSAKGKSGEFSLWDPVDKVPERIEVRFYTDPDQPGMEGWCVFISATTMKMRNWGTEEFRWPGPPLDEYNGYYSTSSAALKAYVDANMFEINDV